MDWELEILIDSVSRPRHFYKISQMSFFSSEMDLKMIFILVIASTIAQPPATSGTVASPPKVPFDDRMFVCFLDMQERGSTD